MGYGAAHNIAIRESIYEDIPYHLVVNPDIILTKEALETMLQFIAQHPDVGSLMPQVVYPNGEIQRLCKLLPTPMDVFGRRFLPSKWMCRRNARYEMHASGYDKLMNVPYLSGCFMLLRTQAAQEARLFDERFFMYPEDMDLTRRIHRDYLTVFFPHATIIHNHEKASYKSLKMLWIHIVNMCRYFNKWGWFCDKERTLFNQTAIREYL
jgi:GT2 family glycosyltransferase